VTRRSDPPTPLSVAGVTDRGPYPPGLRGPSKLTAAPWGSSNIVPSLADIAAFVLLRTVALMHLVTRVPDSVLAAIVPLAPDSRGQLVAEMSHLTTTALAMGPLSRRRAVWRQSGMTLAVALGVRFALVHHPEGAVASLVVVAVLVIDRRRSDVRNSPIRGRLAIVGVGAISHPRRSCQPLATRTPGPHYRCSDGSPPRPPSAWRAA